MGKKRVIVKSATDGEVSNKTTAKSTRRQLEHGLLYINSTYNNTMITLTDEKGNAILFSSSGSLGFKGAKKGTPFAAGKVGDFLAEKAQVLGLKEVDIIVKGVGAGRESSIRAFTSRGIGISSIKDTTPIPFNGPKPPKPRRV
ncbi:MAG: 30S ribosomal protein S11 [Patescibacteria group bacterium]